MKLVIKNLDIGVAFKKQEYISAIRFSFFTCLFLFVIFIICLISDTSLKARLVVSFLIGCLWLSIIYKYYIAKAKFGRYTAANDDNIKLVSVTGRSAIVSVNDVTVTFKIVSNVNTGTKLVIDFKTMKAWYV